MSYSFVSSIRTALLLVACFLSCAPAHAERYALLIGVTEYPELGTTVPQLTGPRNDVLLMHDVLRRAWKSSDGIRVLADGLENASFPGPRPEAALPTRSAILDAMRELAELAQPGDEVIVYFAGHGSQMGERVPGSETDGLDEIFLPIDFEIRENSDDQTVAIKNHIRDDEIHLLLDSILAKGASVWLIADTCHSGTLARSSSSADARPRFLTSFRGDDRLIDLNLSVEPARSSVGTPGSGSGRFVEFAAAAPNAVAMEEPYPSDAPIGEQRQHGNFTWALARAIESQDFATFNDLATRLNTLLSPWGNGGTRPFFEGSLETRLFLEGDGARRWPIAFYADALFVDAGQFNGVHNGAIMRVSDPEDDTNEPLFFATVKESGLSQARLEILTTNKEKSNRLYAELARQGFKEDDLDEWLRAISGRLRAELEEPAIPFVLRVARPVSADPLATDGLMRANKALEEIVAPSAKNLRPAIDLVSSGGLADVRLILSQGRLWIVPDAGDLVMTGSRQPRSISIEEVDRKELEAQLRQIFKARNMVRVASQFLQTDLVRNLAYRVLIERREGVDDDGNCPSTSTNAYEEIKGFDDAIAGVLEIPRCAIVRVEIRNEGPLRVSVSPFYVSSIADLQYVPYYPNGRYVGLGLDPGTTEAVMYVEDVGPGEKRYSSGSVRLVMVVIEDRYGTSPDYRYLESTTATRSQAPQGASISNLMDEAAFGRDTSRSGLKVPGEIASGAILIDLATVDTGEDLETGARP